MGDRLADYIDILRQLSNKEVAALPHEIAARAEAYRYLTDEHEFSVQEVRYLLKFKNPLQVVADEFEQDSLDDHDHAMWNLLDKEDALQGDYELMSDTRKSKEMSPEEQLYTRLTDNLSEYKADVFRTREDEGFEGNGYDWTSLAQVFVDESEPNWAGIIMFDPEASMFCAYSDNKEALKNFAIAFKNTCENDILIRDLFSRAELD